MVLNLGILGMTQGQKYLAPNDDGSGGTAVIEPPVIKRDSGQVSGSADMRNTDSDLAAQLRAAVDDVSSRNGADEPSASQPPQQQVSQQQAQSTDTIPKAPPAPEQAPEPRQEIQDQEPDNQAKKLLGESSTQEQDIGQVADGESGDEVEPAQMNEEQKERLVESAKSFGYNEKEIESFGDRLQGIVDAEERRVRESIQRQAKEQARKAPRKAAQQEESPPVDPKPQESDGTQDVVSKDPEGPNIDELIKQLDEDGFDETGLVLLKALNDRNKILEGHIEKINSDARETRERVEYEASIAAEEAFQQDASQFIRVLSGLDEDGFFGTNAEIPSEEQKSRSQRIFDDFRVLRAKMIEMNGVDPGINRAIVERSFREVYPDQFNKMQDTQFAKEITEQSNQRMGMPKSPEPKGDVPWDGEATEDPVMLEWARDHGFAI